MPGFAFFSSFRTFPARTVCFFFGSGPVSGGGDDGIRTHDPLLAGQVLSQLSYTPILLPSAMISASQMISLRDDILADDILAFARVISLPEQWVFAFSPKDPSKLNNESIRT